VPQGLVAPASELRFEMEAIWASRRDLAKMAHPGVEMSGNIDIFLRHLSLRWAILTQTSKALVRSL
jgi:hypothetical protein